MEWLKVGKSFKKPDKDKKEKKSDEKSLFPVSDPKRRDKKNETKLEAKFDIKNTDQDAFVNQALALIKNRQSLEKEVEIFQLRNKQVRDFEKVEV
jgi:hypothetical protein